MKIFQHSSGSYDKRAVCQPRATAHYHFCRDSIARVPLNGRNRLDGNRAGHRFARFPPTERHDDTTGLFLLVSRRDLINRVIGGRLVSTCSCFTSEPRHYETSKRGGKIGEAKGKRNNSEDELSCFVFVSRFVRTFYLECNNTSSITKLGSITIPSKN